MAAAARLALRGHGGAEPNPLVGCVLVATPGSGPPRIVGAGLHREYGGPHAEIDALRAAGDLARGATAYVTLEPCDHHGQTGPCSEALIEAGVARVVIARADPNPEAAGGAARLAAAGVRVDHFDGCGAAIRVGDPFVHRVRTGRPWVVAKWAQTLDGRIATRTGESRWISSATSRRCVHRERGRVDAIMVGIGTVRSDNPRLTARGVRVRRVARRVVVDPALETPAESHLVTTARAVPTLIACDEATAAKDDGRAAALRAAGVEILGLPVENGNLALTPLLETLATRHDAANVIAEGGSRLVGSLFRERLVCAAWVFVAPLVLGDPDAVPCVTGLAPEALTDGVPMTLVARHDRGGDLMLHYRVG